MECDFSESDYMEFEYMKSDYLCVYQLMAAGGRGLLYRCF
jgi:hypothetical protein